MAGFGYNRRQQRQRRKVIIITAIAVAVLLIVYLLISLYFRNHFYFRTEVNGLKVGGMTVEEAKEKIAVDVGDYLLTIYGRDGAKYHIMGRDIGAQYVPNEEPEQAMQSQNMFGWFLALFKESHLDVTTPMSFEETKLETAVAALSCFAEENITSPVDAKVEKQEKEFVVVPEIMGNRLRLDAVTEAVKVAVGEGKGELTLTDELYVNPNVCAEDDMVLNTMDTLTLCQEAQISYYEGENGMLLDKDAIFSMLQVGDDFSVFLEEKKLERFVQEVATKYNTYGDVRKFQTSSGDVVEIGGGDYGWVVNKEKEAELIWENVKSGQKLTREPVYSQKAKVMGENDIGNTYVEIDYTKQHMWYYKDGQLVLESDVVSGNIATQDGSPDGIFKIVYKKSPAVLVGKTYEAEVAYFMPFAYDVGFHDATWRSTFGGNYYKTSGSHGCINLPGEIAASLYQMIEVDTPVVAYYREKVELTKENCKISNAYSYVEPEEEKEERARENSQ